MTLESIFLASAMLAGTALSLAVLAKLADNFVANIGTRLRERRNKKARLAQYAADNILRATPVSPATQERLTILARKLRAHGLTDTAVFAENEHYARRAEASMAAAVDCYDRRANEAAQLKQELAADAALA